jgi:hypothetical protein
VPDPLSIGRAASEAAKNLIAFATADPIALPVCETKIIHDGRGFRWNRQLAVHRLPDGRLEQKLIGRRRRPSPIEVVVGAGALILAIVLVALIMGWAHLP